jgi:hypothetical protein
MGKWLFHHTLKWPKKNFFFCFVFFGTGTLVMGKWLFHHTLKWPKKQKEEEKKPSLKVMGRGGEW